MAFSNVIRWKGTSLTVADLRDLISRLDRANPNLDEDTTRVRVSLVETPPTRVDHAVTEIVLEVVI